VTEAARASLHVAFADLGLEEVVSMAVPANARSLAVMERIGMTHDPADDFDHPLLEGWVEARHVIYRMSRQRWTSGAAD
jgi:ribosomal-protein-alanine N-acetyltransferase